MSSMESAGVVHEKIEEYYMPCIDFEGITELKNRYINMLENR